MRSFPIHTFLLNINISFTFLQFYYSFNDKLSYCFIIDFNYFFDWKWIVKILIELVLLLQQLFFVQQQFFIEFRENLKFVRFQQFNGFNRNKIFQFFC